MEPSSRTAHALAHPADDPARAMELDLAADDVQRDGNVLHSILAVDR